MSRLTELRRDFDEFRRRRPDAVTVPMSVDALAALLAVAEAGLAVDDDWRSINWPTSEHYEALATAIAPLLADGTDREPTPDVSKPAHDESSIACDVVCGTSSETVPDAHEEDVRGWFDCHDPDEHHTTGYWLSIPDFDRILARLEAAEKRAQVAEAERDWLAEFAADTIEGVNDMFVEALGESVTVYLRSFQPTKEELLAEAREAVERGE